MYNNKYEKHFQIGDIMKTYKTKQKDIIIETIKKQTSEFTIKDIYEELKQDVGLTTIYRMVDELIAKGTLTKTINEYNVPTYCYLTSCPCQNHLYLKCDKCGHMLHIDCECVKELSDHITNNHQFQINNSHIIISGTCEKCLKKVTKC